MADTPKQPYGDVPYADPGLQKDGKKRYPIDTAAHAKAAWSYINQADNASQYSAEDLAKVKAKIKAACKKFGIEISDQANDEAPSLENRIRGVFPLELRDVGDGIPTLHGHFAVFNQWARIDSMVEGQFMESIAPGAFRKTFQENRQRMRVLFNHGKDPQAGMKPLGPIAELREDEEGAYYEVPLLDTSYVRDLLPGLRAGLYGASFQFSVTKERPNRRPTRTDYNPDAWPETTILEAKVKEFGPVTFPAYQDADAGVRSLTDDFIVMQLVRDPERFQSLVQRYVPSVPSVSSALSRSGAEATHSATGEPQKTRWPQVSREEFIGTSRSGRSPFDP